MSILYESDFNFAAAIKDFKQKSQGDFAWAHLRVHVGDEWSIVSDFDEAYMEAVSKLEEELEEQPEMYFEEWIPVARFYGARDVQQLVLNDWEDKIYDEVGSPEIFDWITQHDRDVIDAAVEAFKKSTASVGKWYSNHEVFWIHTAIGTLRETLDSGEDTWRILNWAAMEVITEAQYNERNQNA